MQELTLKEQLRSMWSKPSFLYAIRSVYSALSGSTLATTFFKIQITAPKTKHNITNTAEDN